MTYRSFVDVHLILQDPDGHVLLAERAGTGYADGLLNVPGGKLEDGEDALTAAVREAREEVGVDVDPADVEFVTVVHHRNPAGQARVGFFATRRWTGTPRNAEPDKCARILWADPDDLPAQTLPYSATGIAQLKQHDRFVLDGWTRADARAYSLA